eukprot:438076_1
MTPSLIALIFLSILPTYQSNTITSCGEGIACDCTDNEPCIVNCNGEESCEYATINVNAASSISFTCNGRYTCHDATINGPTTNIPFAITCSGGGTVFSTSYACGSMVIDAGSASSFDLYCNGDGYTNTCSLTEVNCGSATGTCTIHCNGEDACSSLSVDCGNASECGLLCDYGWNIACETLRRLDCRHSICWMECGTLLTACRRQYTYQNVYTNNAISFICNGIGCDTYYINALKTAKPTAIPTILTIEPSNNPSINPTESTEPPSVSPTYSPSKAPTNTSAAPTEPSVSPTYLTTCADANPNKATNDGFDIITNHSISEIYRNF